jgi:general nucleoside transport system permease protein
LYKTRPGLHLRAVGKARKRPTPWASSVFKLRYFYTMVGGMLAGLGGAHLSLAYTPGWTEHLTGGRGWIAIALVIFATWDPLRAVVGALFVWRGECDSVPFAGDGDDDPVQFVTNMLPYILTVVVLVAITWFESFRKRVGKSAGRAGAAVYAPEERS